MIALKATMDKQSETDFNRVLELLNEYSGATNDLALLQAAINEEQMAVVDRHLEEYSTIQSILTLAEGELERIARAHPEWFPDDKRSLKTPVGTLKMHTSNPLEVENAEMSIALIEREAELKDGQFVAEPFVHTEKTLNLQALATLDDAMLKRFRIKRASKENFSIAPVKLDMGKAIKEATAKKAKAKA